VVREESAKVGEALSAEELKEMGAGRRGAEGPPGRRAACAKARRYQSTESKVGFQERGLGPHLGQCVDFGRRVIWFHFPEVLGGTTDWRGLNLKRGSLSFVGARS
jgi:hypothetical protein